MSGRRKNVAIESFLVVILMIVFAIAVAVLIVQGSTTFQRTLDHREAEENLRIAMSYMNMVIRQNDSIGAIEFPNPPSDIQMLMAIKHSGQEGNMRTYVYFKDGFLYECYTDGPIDPKIATPIVPLRSLSLNYDAPHQLVTLRYAHTIDGKPTTLEQIISLRAGEVVK